MSPSIPEGGRSQSIACPFMVGDSGALRTACTGACTAVSCPHCCSALPYHPCSMISEHQAWCKLWPPAGANAAAQKEEDRYGTEEV